MLIAVKWKYGLGEDCSLLLRILAIFPNTGEYENSEPIRVLRNLVDEFFKLEETIKAHSILNNAIKKFCWSLISVRIMYGRIRFCYLESIPCNLLKDFSTLLQRDFLGWTFLGNITITKARTAIKQMPRIEKFNSKSSKTKRNIHLKLIL